MNRSSSALVPHHRYFFILVISEEKSELRRKTGEEGMAFILSSHNNDKRIRKEEEGRGKSGTETKKWRDEDITLDGQLFENWKEVLSVCHILMIDCTHPDPTIISINTAHIYSNSSSSSQSNIPPTKLTSNADQIRKVSHASAPRRRRPAGRRKHVSAELAGRLYVCIKVKPVVVTNRGLTDHSAAYTYRVLNQPCQKLSRA